MKRSNATLSKETLEGLEKCTYKNTNKFSFNGQTYLGKCVKVYDGDTITIACFLFGSYQRFSVRMLRYDTPERGHRAKTTAEAAWGDVAKETLSKKLLGKIVTIQCGEFSGGYGVRILGEIICEGENINDFMYNLPYTQPCDGKRDLWVFALMPDGSPAVLPNNMLVLLQNGNAAIMKKGKPHSIQSLPTKVPQGSNDVHANTPIIMPKGVPLVSARGTPLFNKSGMPIVIPIELVEKNIKDQIE